MAKKGKTNTNIREIGILTVVAVVCLAAAYGAYQGWFRSLTAPDQESEQKEIAEQLLQPYAEQDQPAAGTEEDTMAPDTSARLESVLMSQEAAVDQTEEQPSERSDTAGQEDLLAAKEGVMNLLGVDKAVYYIRDHFFPLSKISDYWYYAALVDLSFEFDEDLVLVAVCQGRTNERSDAWCRAT